MICNLLLLTLLSEITASSQVLIARLLKKVTSTSGTINHIILLNKLDHYGIRDHALNLISSYLNDRQQFVQFKDKTSNEAIVKCSVLQRSILGPLLFINDLPNASSLIEPILFADATSIFYSHKDVDNLTLTLNLELNKVSTWMKANKLSVNLKKQQITFYLDLVGKRYLHRYLCWLITRSLRIKIQPNSLVHTLTKYLTWKTHINYVCSKISKTSALFMEHDII